MNVFNYVRQRSPWCLAILYFALSYYISHQYSILDSTCLSDLVHQLSLKSLATRIINTSNFKRQEDYEDALVKHKPDGVIVLGTSDTITNILLQVCNHYIVNMITYVKQNYIKIWIRGTYSITAHAVISQIHLDIQYIT